MAISLIYFKRLYILPVKTVTTNEWLDPQCVFNREKYEDSFVQPLKSLHLKSTAFPHWANNGLDHHANNHFLYPPYWCHFLIIAISIH